LIRFYKRKMTGGTEQDRCFLCPDLDTTTWCTDCRSLPFCPDHQQFHKIGPGGSCCCVRYEDRGAAGRGLMATRDYAPGEVIFQIQPAASGPCVRTEPQCVSCCKLLHSRSACSRCLLPVCNKQCERSLNHQPECQVLSRIRTGMKGEGSRYKEQIPNLTSAVMTIRLYSLKWRNAGIWKLVSMLMDHDEVPAQLWAPLQQAFNTVLSQDSRFIETEWRRVFGIQSTNGANLHLPATHGRAFGLYPVFALLNHSCMCNTETLESRSDHTVYLKARFHIKAGEEVTTCYLKPEQATFARRQFLFSKWNFWCTCHRCADPSELGAFCGAVICERSGCGGYLLPESPLVEESPWYCNICAASAPWSHATAIMQQALQVVEEAGAGVEHLEHVLHQLHEILHPRHYMLVQIEIRLAFVYLESLREPRETRPSRPLLDRIIQITENILIFLDKTNPGSSQLRRIVEEANSSLKLERACQDYKCGSITREKVQKLLLLKQARMCSTNK